MRALPATHTSSMTVVDRALVIATLGFFVALVLRAIADPQIATSSIDATDAVPVAPPVGFVQIAIPEHSDALVSIPFKIADVSLDAILAGQLTASTNLAATDLVLIWDAQNSRYRTAAKLILPGSTSTDGQWFAVETSESGVETIAGPVGNDFRVTPGVGFILRNRQDREQTVRLGGEVVVEGVQSVAIPSGPSIASYPFTTAKDVNETKLGKSGNVLSTNAFRMGAGSWVSAQKPDVWNEVRPYSNPFATNNLPVRVSDLLLDSDRVTLSIRIADSSVQSVDVLIMDLVPTSVVTDWTGWRLAAANIDTTGKTEIHWSDDLTTSASSFKGVRLYLVTRADSTMDLDGDGISDSTEVFLRPNVVSHTRVPDSTQVVVDGGLGSVLPNTPVCTIYVNIHTGDDTFTGRSKFATTVKQGSGLVHGPKKSIKAALRDATDGDTIQIEPGAYPENLNIAGKPINATVTGNVTLGEGTK